MRILFAASEAAPFIKTGGLADVAGSLPTALAAKGHDVKVILPLYEGISGDWRGQMTFLKYFDVTLAWRSVYCGIFQLKYNGVDYWFVDNEYYFKRWQLYGHFDDCERFAFFSRAVIETPGQLDWAPDIIHCNDWQTALVPIYLLEEKYRIPQLGGARSVYTIHNIEYQGRYGDQVLQDVIGLDVSYFNEGMLAFYDDVNLMKGAIMASNYVTTVSPTYAEELRLPFYAHGLAGVINDQSAKIQGILNGIDMDLYDPSKPSGLPASFTAKAPAKGKAACKQALQQAVGLNQDPDVPIIACISRLVGHKGFSLVTDVLHEIMGMNVQMVVLGTGEWQYEDAFRTAQGQYPGRFSAQLTYSGPLSTLIYAGSDIFLMPSVSEPCGLSQMIAMRYGTVPVVRETGGLRDTVYPYNKFEGTGRGFTFSDINAGDMLWVLREAVGLYYDNKEAWRGLQKEGMTADFSWDNSAQQYLDIYQRISG
ncbi:MAG: glycogen synthase GlgA [Lawsonibacter sp.]|nr:glycogen synthase GlgA [Lawsonibacter sp.]